MKGPKIKDERIITEIQKFSTHGLLIVLVGFMISLLVKVFILEWHIKYWIDTFVIMLLGCLYVTVRCVKDGIYLLPSKEGELKRFKKIHLISGVISTIIWATLTFLLDFREADIRKNISSTLVGSVVFFIGVTWAMWYIINKSNKNADKNIEN